MIAQSDVNYLVGTYSLPRKTAVRIEQIVLGEHRQNPFPSFDEVYNRVTSLVDSFTASREERVSLDHQPKGDGFFFKSGIFTDSADACKDEDPVEDNSASNSDLTVVEALSLLLTKLSPAQRSVVEYLVRESRKHEGERYRDPERAREESYTSTYTIPPGVLESPDLLIAKLEHLVRTYTDNGTIRIPRRPVVYVRWNPQLWVRYGRRNFDGNPLKFFRDNIDVYGVFTTQLALRHFDSGLLEALRRAGQVHEAIPLVEKRERQLTAEQEAEIIGAYQTCNGSIRAIEKSLTFTVWEEVIKRCLVAHGIQIRKPGEQPSVSVSAQRRMRHAFVKYGSAYEASRHVPYSTTTILKYARLDSLYVRKAGSRIHPSNLPETQLQAIDTAFESCGGNISKASRQLGNTRRAIRNRWKEQGFLSNGNGTV